MCVHEWPQKCSHVTILLRLRRLIVAGRHLHGHFLYCIDISGLSVDFVCQFVVLVEHLFPASAAGWWMSS